jgi:sterol desaturase/sphingolipid hydroxylase (fatty acid hydroxylase superfamily)
MNLFLHKVIQVLAEPFSSMESITAALEGIASNITSLQSRTAWLYLLSSLFVAYVVFKYGARRGQFGARPSFKESVFPRDVYLHRSALTDYKFVLFDKCVRMFLYVPLFSAVTYVLYRSTTQVVGHFPVHVSSTAALTIVPFWLLVVTDFSYFVAHWLMHRVPVLWIFHEVHHSADVLTPVTAYRVHPLEDLLTNSITAVLTALSAALFTSATTRLVDPLSIFGVNALLFGFYLFGFQLRHSHVWLSYGPFWSRIFISPAQHQIHHSLAERHWNKNFGYMFALWDVIFGTVYVPREREHIVFGCGTEPDEYSTVAKLYLRPFVKAWSLVRSNIRRNRGLSEEVPAGGMAPSVDSVDLRALKQPSDMNAGQLAASNAAVAEISSLQSGSVTSTTTAQETFALASDATVPRQDAMFD